MGKTCVICGKPSGMYPLCREHLQMKNEGFIVKCEDCGQWHFVDSPCSCQKSATYTELPTEGFEMCVSCGAKTNGYAFCRKCFKKYSNDEMLEILNGRDMVDEVSSDDGEEENDEVSIYSEEYEPSNEDELTCIICGKPSNGKHFCRSCYYRYKNKEILVRIAKCQFPCGEPLDESYEGVYECEDGHIVKSIAEQTIDNYLCEKAIFHGYELPLDIGTDKPLKPDFCLKDYLSKGENVYIEYFGLKGQPDYDKKTAYKMEHYRKNKITLICLYPNTDLKNLRFSLETKLKKEKIKKGEIHYEQN